MPAAAGIPHVFRSSLTVSHHNDDNFSRVDFYSDDGATVKHTRVNTAHNDQNRMMVPQQVLV
jgi:hypothetical protein